MSNKIAIIAIIAIIWGLGIWFVSQPSTITYFDMKYLQPPTKTAEEFDIKSVNWTAETGEEKIFELYGLTCDEVWAELERIDSDGIINTGREANLYVDWALICY